MSVELLEGPVYNPELADVPFLLGRHGESVGNAANAFQGRGPAADNHLNNKGKGQIESAAEAADHAGLEMRYTSNSGMPRTVESDDAFVGAIPEPRKPLQRGAIAADEKDGLREVSQLGWEGIEGSEDLNARDTVAGLRKGKLAWYIGELIAANETLGLDPELSEDGVNVSKLTHDDITRHAGWVMRLGEGETAEDEGQSPLSAALSGIQALERHRIQPRELVFAHGMINRFMDAVATTIDLEGRAQLRELMQDGTLLGQLAVIKALRGFEEDGLKGFAIHDNPANRQANAGITEYTVNVQTGRWIAGRRIEPPKNKKPGSSEHYIEWRRNNDTATWERVTNEGTLAANNE
jgi:broad specificity phosphatase PhoE